ncbi:MAG TPA: VWA domain-containing protein [Acidimicrobiales bacterium]|jgi:Ca-activated chloride channel family protein|nr:VWA domain-containing protein [Acidimicrobiales bacterium]
MNFAWAFALPLLLVAPLVLGAYLWSLRRRRKQAVTYSSVALLRSVIPARSRWRRHLPVGLLIAGLAVLAIASARPQVTSTVAIGRTSIVMALDVSRSMCATDVDPNRLTVEQRAARQFVDNQASGTRMGLIIFSGTAQLAVSPTRDRAPLQQAIDNLTTGNGTAIGAAMLKSLDALSTVNTDVKPVGDVPTPSNGSGNDFFNPIGGGSSPDTTPTTVPPPPGQHGFVPDIVVLLTDGANNRGIAPLDAVPYAVERRVRVYTIGFGTTQIAPLACTSAQLGGDDGAFGGRFAPGGGGYGGGGFSFNGRSPLRADLPTLKEVADRTGGKAYTAEDAGQLQNVFAGLPKDVTVQKKKHEITANFALIGALLALAAVAASIRWSPYP